jgi:hypothetical protein
MRVVEGPVEVNDVHSELNATRVARVCVPGNVDEVVALVRLEAGAGRSLAVHSPARGA